MGLLFSFKTISTFSPVFLCRLSEGKKEKGSVFLGRSQEKKNLQGRVFCRKRDLLIRLSSLVTAEWRTVRVLPSERRCRSGSDRLPDSLTFSEPFYDSRPGSFENEGREHAAAFRCFIMRSSITLRQRWTVINGETRTFCSLLAHLDDKTLMILVWSDFQTFLLTCLLFEIVRTFKIRWDFCCN